MTKSEEICKKLGNLYFFKELVKSNLLYITDKKEEKELADVLMRVDNYILTIQIKEKTTNASNSIENWMNNKVYKVAKNQIKVSVQEIVKKINFKEEDNSDILDNIDKCTIIPIIIFDIGKENIEYKRSYESKSTNLKINIFNIKDFESMCKYLISPMEMIRYLNERIAYSNSNLLTYNDKKRIIIGKNITEDAMLNFYIEKYELNYSEENIDKLAIFNNYLTLFEKHCITNKKQYKIFIKFLSGLYVKEIYCLIDRLNKIIQKGFSKEMYWNSYMISDNHNLLFISLPKEKYNIEFIGFISNVFMCYFKLNNVLSIISYSVDKENYELDFAMCEYDNINEHIYKEAITEGYADVWKKGGIDEKI